MKNQITINGKTYEMCYADEAKIRIQEFNKKTKTWEGTGLYFKEVHPKDFVFPVRVELLDGSYCEIYDGKGIIVKYEDGSECGVISPLELQKINEKMKEIEDAGGFGK